MTNDDYYVAGWAEPRPEKPEQTDWPPGWERMEVGDAWYYDGEQCIKLEPNPYSDDSAKEQP